LDYVIRWREGADSKRHKVDTARQAFHFAKTLIDGGKPGVEISDSSLNCIIKGRAILDISDLIDGRD
jgi:hypothetical protein